MLQSEGRVHQFFLWRVKSLGIVLGPNPSCFANGQNLGATHSILVEVYLLV